MYLKGGEHRRCDLPQPSSGTLHNFLNNFYRKNIIMKITSRGTTSEDLYQKA